jgi:hypothetical protein
MIISNTVSARETLCHLLPFRDAFVALFFVTIGACGIAAFDCGQRSPGTLAREVGDKGLDVQCDRSLWSYPQPTSAVSGSRHASTACLSLCGGTGFPMQSAAPKLNA